MLTQEVPEAHRPAQNQAVTSTENPASVLAIQGTDKAVSPPPHSEAST